MKAYEIIFECSLFNINRILVIIIWLSILRIYSYLCRYLKDKSIRNNSNKNVNLTPIVTACYRFLKLHISFFILISIWIANYQS